MKKTRDVRKIKKKLVKHLAANGSEILTERIADLL